MVSKAFTVLLLLLTLLQNFAVDTLQSIYFFTKEQILQGNQIKCRKDIM